MSRLLHPALRAVCWTVFGVAVLVSLVAIPAAFFGWCLDLHGLPEVRFEGCGHGVWEPTVARLALALSLAVAVPAAWIAHRLGRDVGEGSGRP